MDGAQLGFVVTDADKNVFVYCYEPQDQKSMGGQKLVRAAECNLGQHVNCMFRQGTSVSLSDSGSRICAHRFLL